MNNSCLTHAPRLLAQEGCEFIKFETCSKMALLLRKCIPQLAFRGQLGCRDVFLRFQANLEMTFSRRNWISHEGLNFSRGIEFLTREIVTRKFSGGIEILTRDWISRGGILTRNWISHEGNSHEEILTRNWISQEECKFTLMEMSWAISIHSKVVWFLFDLLTQLVKYGKLPLL